MNFDYYKFPLQFNDLFNSKGLPKCGLGESISQNLQMIIISQHGEHRYNTTYGCEIWDLDFDLIMSLKKWEEKLRKSLLFAISQNETRIEKTDVEVKVSEVEKRYTINDTISIKRRVDIFITSTIAETGERYQFQTNLFLSPVSYNS